MFEAQNVTVRIGSRNILNAVSVQVRPGTLTVFAGPNGAGKSTLLKVLTGELRPDAGAVRFEGTPVREIAPHTLAARRAVLPQSSRLAFPFTVLEVVRLGLECRPGLSPALRRSAPLAALEKVDLGGFGGRHYQELSGGEQQRVHLARILCQVGEPLVHGRPHYIFLDEPTSSLDIRHQIGTLNIARAFADAGGGVLAILHDLNLAAMYADHLVVLHQGEVAAEGAPREVISDELMERVFGVKLKVGRQPERDLPFVLPQAIAG